MPEIAEDISWDTTPLGGVTDRSSSNRPADVYWVRTDHIADDILV
jgi:hypothetical protein